MLNGVKREWRTDDGSVWLMQGDCMEILPQMEANEKTGIVTDPNYGIDADKAKAHSSIRDNSNWSAMGWDSSRPSKEAFQSMLRFPQVAIWGGNYFADLLPASPGWLAWIKPEAETGFSLADMELCWTNKNFAARTKRAPRRDGNLHPTQKPVVVIGWTLKFVTSGTIIDPFFGSGTTGIACLRLGRKFIGIEREPSYFDIACERITEELHRYRAFESIPKITQRSLLEQE